MTVICWDLNTLVADGRSTIAGQIVSDKEMKIRKVEHPELGQLVAAFGGAMIVIDSWIEHIEENGFAPFELPEGDIPGEYYCKGLFVRPDGTAIEVETNGLWAEVTVPSAYGSGQLIAQHFLTAGTDSLTAAKEACKTSTSCGGRLVQFDPATREFTYYE